MTPTPTGREAYDWAALRERRLGQISAEARRKLQVRVDFAPFEEMGVAGFRAMMSDFTGPPQAVEAVEHEDVVASGPRGDIPMRLYRPTGLTAPVGVRLVPQCDVLVRECLDVDHGANGRGPGAARRLPLV